MKIKEPLVIEKQIERIENNKNIFVEDAEKEDAKDFLLYHNYINVITPFKYRYCEWDDEKHPSKTKDNKHVYLKRVNFIEYKENYINERKNYENIFNNISLFETSFKSLLTYYSMIDYNIIDEKHFDTFINNLCSNTGNTETEKKNFDALYGIDYRDKCLTSFKGYKDKIDKNYNENVYVFFDNLSFGESTKIFNCLKKETKRNIFNALKKKDLTFGYQDYVTLGQKLLIINGIRNKVFHSGSLEIYIRFHDVKTSEIRDKKGPFSQEAILNLINILSK